MAIPHFKLVTQNLQLKQYPQTFEQPTFDSPTWHLDHKSPTFTSFFRAPELLFQATTHRQKSFGHDRKRKVCFIILVS